MTKLKEMMAKRTTESQNRIEKRIAEIRQEVTLTNETCSQFESQGEWLKHEAGLAFAKLEAEEGEFFSQDKAKQFMDTIKTNFREHQ